MRRGLLRHDLAWAGFILGIAACFGLVQHWDLVRISLRGELASSLEKIRAERRQEKFQGVLTVSLDQVYRLFQQGQALFIDSRPGEEYAELHIPGAINLPPEGLGESAPIPLAGIAQDRQIVVYCGQVSCDAALKVAEKLQALGFTQVRAFLEGFNAWDQAGYPVDTIK
jgi:rhodanese-related sulfurtransferase